MKTSVDTLKNGCVCIAYPAELREGVARSMRLWKQFCELPVEVKRGLPFEGETGYEFKDGSGNKADRKENFELTRGGLDRLLANAEKISDPIALQFVQSVADLLSLIEPVVFEFARSVEREYGIDGFEDEVRKSTDTFFPRFIHYFGEREVGEETASAHVDQSGFTLHLFESGPGLQRMEFNTQEWVPMLVSEGETVIIPAMQMQLRSRGRLKATPHRVIALPETAEGRYSSVCFVRLALTAVYDKATHGRLQEWPAGFNLDMAFEDFAKMFKSN